MDHADCAVPEYNVPTSSTDPLRIWISPNARSRSGGATASARRQKQTSLDRWMQSLPMPHGSPSTSRCLPGFRGHNARTDDGPPMTDVVLVPAPPVPHRQSSDGMLGDTVSDPAAIRSRPAPVGPQRVNNNSDVRKVLRVDDATNGARRRDSADAAPTTHACGCADACDASASVVCAPALSATAQIASQATILVASPENQNPSLARTTENCNDDACQNSLACTPARARPRSRTPRRQLRTPVSDNPEPVLAPCGLTRCLHHGHARCTDAVPTEPRDPLAADIARLHSIPYPATNAGPYCVICMNHVRAGGEVVVLDCGTPGAPHTSHTSCLLREHTPVSSTLKTLKPPNVVRQAVPLPLLVAVYRTSYSPIFGV